MGINIMAIDATFWVAVSFIIFFGGLIYLKVPQKINKIAIDTSSELVKKLIGAEVNNSSISAIVDDLSKKNGNKYYGN